MLEADHFRHPSTSSCTQNGGKCSRPKYAPRLGIRCSSTRPGMLQPCLALLREATSHPHSLWNNQLLRILYKLRTVTPARLEGAATCGQASIPCSTTHKGGNKPCSLHRVFLLPMLLVSTSTKRRWCHCCCAVSAGNQYSLTLSGAPSSTMAMPSFSSSASTRSLR